MSLDLTRLVSQVGGMVAGLKAGAEERQKHLQFALEVVGNEAIDLDDLKKKINASKTTWLVAGLVDGLNRRYEAPSTPDEFTVMAADGSHIDVDRHRSARCYLINIGSAVLCYGAAPDAVLDSFPRLYADEKDMVISHPGGGREYLLDSNLLGTKRSIEEWRRLADLAAELPKNSCALALLDGTLIHWGLDGYPDFVCDELLIKGFLRCLDDMKKLNGERKLALASYISFPGSTDVANVLKVAVCPNDPPNCDTHCPPGKERDCEKVAGMRDRDLFINLLGPGERSALFTSPSKIIEKHYGAHRVYFFYIRLDDEIARIEIPQWVAENNDLLHLTHSLVLDQCRRGQGYPVALSEAHEQAVVTGADRENFWQLVESLLVEERLPALSSAKSQSKRTRWV